MTRATLDRLLAVESQLVQALDGEDIAALETVTLDFAEALKDVKATAAWSDEPDILERIRHALALTEAARSRVNYLTDRNRRRLELLAGTIKAEWRTPAYGPDGRIRAA
jgi:hypothetical protein